MWPQRHLPFLQTASIHSRLGSSCVTFDVQRGRKLRAFLPSQCSRKFLLRVLCSFVQHPQEDMSHSHRDNRKEMLFFKTMGARCKWNPGENSASRDCQKMAPVGKFHFLRLSILRTEGISNTDNELLKRKMENWNASPEPQPDASNSAASLESRTCFWEFEARKFYCCFRT